jgi:hypothetical protein
MSSSSDNFKLLEKALKLVPKIVSKKARAAKRQRAAIELFKVVSKQIQKVYKENEDKAKLLKNRKQHPWRICPIGEYWVSDYRRRYQTKSKNYPGTYPVSGTCRLSPTPHDYLDASEIKQMSEEHLKDDFLRPNPSRITFEDPKSAGDMYDDLIGLWTTYWNQMLPSDEPLDPDLVKALIATESGFKYWAKAKVPHTKNVYALGLLQVRDDYVKILSKKGELKDFFIVLKKQDLYDPAVGIATGIRWLFHKRDLIEKKLKRKLKWNELILYYKGFVDSKGRPKPNADTEQKKFNRFYKLMKS